MKLTRIPAQWDARWFASVWEELLADANSLVGHVAASDPHSQYATDDDLTDHVDAADPHSQYATDDDLAAHVVVTDPHPELIDDLSTAAAVYDTDRVLVGQDGKQRTGRLDQVRDLIFGDHWTDLVIPAVAINPLGSATPPALNNASGLLEFSATTDNVVIFSWQLPHGWSGEFDSTKAVVVPHLHVRHLTSTSAPNNVSKWKLEYDVADVNGNFANAYEAWTTLATVPSTNPANTAKCGLLSFGNLDLAGYGASAILHCKVSRLASSDAEDTESSVIALYSADLHIQHRAAGTATSVPSKTLRPATGRVRLVGQ